MKLRIAAYDLISEESMNRLFVIGGKVRAYDLTDDHLLAVLPEIKNPNHVYFSKKNNLIIIQSTIGDFGVYTYDTYKFIKRVKIRAIANTDHECFYSEEENMIYGICTDSSESLQSFFTLSINDLTYKKYNLPELKLEEQKPKERFHTIYELIKYEDGKFYMIRNFYNLKNFEPYEACYGIFKVPNGKIECTKKLFVTTEKNLRKWDLKGFEQMKSLREKYDDLYPPYGLLEKIHIYASDIYVVYSNAIFKVEKDGTETVIYEGQFISDFFIHDGKKYIGTCEYLLIE